MAEKLTKVVLGITKLTIGETRVEALGDIVDVVTNADSLFKDLAEPERDIARGLVAAAEARLKAFDGKPGFPADQLKTAKLHMEQALDHCVPAPGTLARHDLDPARIARAMIDAATAVAPQAEFTLFYTSGKPEWQFSRKFFLQTAESFLADLLSKPAAANCLATALWREILPVAHRTEDKVDVLSGKMDLVLEAILAGHGNREPIGLTLKAARNIIAHYPGEDPPDDPAEIERLLIAKAKESQLLRERLAELDNSADLVIRDLLQAASGLIESGDYDSAEEKLIAAEARTDELRARIRSKRGDLANLQGNYREAAWHYATAAAIAVADLNACWRYQLCRANTLRDLGVEFGDKSALIEAVDLYLETVLPLGARTESPECWATSQNNRGIALLSLGNREMGMERLNEAVAAFRSVTTIFTRDVAPPHWAM
ncbi:MAG TPA: hypothetical protein VLA52_04825, partial [Thermohalobaculum sp.]|nr:hypothetical protein [Thermohalobaculum sp.]